MIIFSAITNQVILVTHSIYKAFDANPSLEVRVVFLDLSKAFENVWHEGLLYKLKRMEICEKYLTNRLIFV